MPALQPTHGHLWCQPPDKWALPGSSRFWNALLRRCQPPPARDVCHANAVPERKHVPGRLPHCCDRLKCSSNFRSYLPGQPGTYHQPTIDLAASASLRRQPASQLGCNAGPLHCMVQLGSFLLCFASPTRTDALTAMSWSLRRQLVVISLCVCEPCNKNPTEC